MADWDRIMSSAPINRDAAMAASAKGNHYDDRQKHYRWDACPPLRDLSEVRASPSFQDLTGARFGRLKVLGMWGSDTRSKSAQKRQRLWVCKCSCGDYAGISSKSLTRGTLDRCPSCEHTRNLRDKPPLYVQLADKAKREAQS